MMRTVTLRRLFACMLALSACATPKPDPLRQYLDIAEAAGTWNGIAVVAERGKIIFERGTLQNDSTGMPRYAADIAFPIASVSKTITATAILQLVQARKLSVDTKVSSILDGFPYPELTVRHLLSHTSGLPPYNAYLAETLAAHPDTVFYNADVLRVMIAHPVPLKYPSGTNGNYDNINYLILALVIEKCSGVLYQQYIAQHILEPAGMRGTRPMPVVDQLRDTLVAAPRMFAHLYSASTIPSLSVPYIVSYWNSYRLEGFGDYVSTARDLLRYHEALESGRLVDTMLLRSAYVAVRLADGRVNPGRFGLGWVVDTSRGLVVSHEGSSVGLNTMFVRDLTKGRVIIVFDNAHSTAPRVASALSRLRDGDSVAPPRRDLTRYIGNLIMTVGKDSALSAFTRLHADSAHWSTNEDAINLLGYDFMGSPGAYKLPVEHRYDEAAAVFELNTRLSPKSWNVWDSYGESLAALGERERAIMMYERALELNPGNQSSTDALKRLRQ